MRPVYIIVVLLGVAAILVDHLSQSLEWPRGVTGRFRRRLRALWRALSVEEITFSAILPQQMRRLRRAWRAANAAKFRAFECAAALAKRIVATGDPLERQREAAVEGVASA